MARWTGEEDVAAVLEAGDAWRERCFASSLSIFTDTQLWTLENLQSLLKRFTENPIAGNAEFVAKLQDQLKGADAAIIQLAAETLWLLFLFPSASTMKASTKLETIQSVWAWSGAPVPQSIYLDDAHLGGVGHPGTAYMTHRPAEYEYLLRTVMAFKSLPASEQAKLLRDEVPWLFIDWLGEQQGSDRRLFRGALLYFLFPDHLERSLSTGHRRQIYDAFKGKLPVDQRVKSKEPSLAEIDKAINAIRQILMTERGVDHLDFYQDDIKTQWFAPFKERSSKDFSSWLNNFLVDRGLQLNQSGRDIKKLDDKRKISEESGFWEERNFVTSKPPRWLLHFDATSQVLKAKVPEEHRAGVIGFANTKGGNSGALTVRILPVVKSAENKFHVVETWEWLLLFCFPGGLEPGSSAEAFENFDVETGVLTYKQKSQPYIFSALLCLNGPDETFSVNINGKLKIISYKDATEALLNLIKIAPAGEVNG